VKTTVTNTRCAWLKEKGKRVDAATAQALFICKQSDYLLDKRRLMANKIFVSLGSFRAVRALFQTPRPP